jgi:EmrB/QacA subfamily drug resistance transporter
VSAAAAAPAVALDHKAIRGILAGIMLAMFLGALDQTIVATALPTIGQDLGDLAGLPWVVTAYLLSSTAVTPLYGKLSDIHGRRAMLLASIALFVLGSLACALAPSMLVLILARALQGVGGGGLISLAQTVIADVVAPKERARYQGLIASVFVASSVLGPVLGGVFAQTLHWSLIFWINLPLGLAALWMTERALRRLPRHERPHRLDLIGAGLIVFATVCFLLALSWGGVRQPWGSPPILGLIGASLALAVLFAWRLRVAPEPFLPLPVLREPVVALGTASACFAMGTFIGLSIYVPVYFEAARGLTASQSGLALIPLMAGVILGATTAARLMARIRHYKRPPLAGLALAVSGCLMLAPHPVEMPFPVALLLLALVGVGVGTVLPVTTVAIQNAVPLHQLGTATGVMSFFRALGGAIAVAGFGALVLGGARSHDGGPLTLAGDSDAVFSVMFLVAAVGFAAAFAFLLLMAERPLRSRVAKPAAEPVRA